MTGKTILITGGASGLGLSTAQAAAKAGAQVLITDIHEPKDAIEDLVREGHEAHFIHCNVASWDSQTAMFRKASELAGPRGIDAVAMFAAIDNQPNMVDLVNASPETPVKPDTLHLDVNLTGVVYTSYLALHYMRQSVKEGEELPDKSLLFISSMAGYLENTHNSFYTASKFGCRGLFRSFRARASAELGVRCNLIAPWLIKTPLTAPIVKGLKQYGIQEGHGITFADPQVLVDAAMKCFADRSVSGAARSNI